MNQQHVRRAARAAIGTAGAVALFGLAAIGAPPAGAHPGFVDIAGNVHEPAILSIADAGITSGCDDTGTRYCPGQPVTRGQMATFPVRALGLAPASSGTFSDTHGNLHAGSIDRLATEGIAAGGADGRFRPDDPVTREQMATFLARAFRLPTAGSSAHADVSGTHAAGVASVAASGISRGCTDDGRSFCPTRLVTRDQMASFLARALALGAVPPPLPDAGEPPDEPPSLAMTSTDASTPKHRGTLSASCNSNIAYRDAGRPHVYVWSSDLAPAGGASQQWYTTLEWVYHYESATWTRGAANQYLSDTNPNSTTFDSPMGPEFFIGTGWYAAYVQAWAWNGTTWVGPAGQWVVFEETGGYWCRGL